MSETKRSLGSSADPTTPREHNPLPQIRIQRKLPTWVKLWTVVLLANIGGFTVSIWVAASIRAIPSSQAVESALMFGYYAAMAVVTALEALLLDELLCRGAFRKTHLEGLSARFSTGSVEDLAASMQRTSVSFPLLLMVCGAVTYLLFNLVNHGFNAEYRQVGRHVVALHVAEDAEQIAAIQSLSIRREPQVLPALRWRAQQGGEPAQWAVWALGRFTDLPTRRPLKAPLVSASRSDDPALRREALVALGRIQHRAADTALQTEIRAMRSRGEPVDLRLVYGLGSIQTLSSIPLLEELLHIASVPTQRMAAWALAQHRDQRGGRNVVKILEDRMPSAHHDVRCAIVHSLGILADEASNRALMQVYDRATPEQRATECHQLQLSFRADGALDDRADLFMPADTLAMKVLMTMAQMRATSTDVRRQVEPWLAGLVDADATDPVTREAARSLQAGIRSGRDDRDAPSIEEALGL